MTPPPSASESPACESRSRSAASSAPESGRPASSPSLMPCAYHDQPPRFHSLETMARLRRKRVSAYWYSTMMREADEIGRRFENVTRARS